MLDLLKQYKQAVEENKQLLLDFQNPPANIPNPEITLNNNNLLIGCLIKIFEEEKARYLPASITSAVSELINGILKGIESFVKDPQSQSHFISTIQTMDNLYACCLQYGLITFGFSGKEETQMIENARNAISEITIQTKNLRKAIKTNNEKAESLLAQFDQYIQKLNADSQQRLKDFEENLQTNRTTAETNVSKIAEVAEVVNGYQNSSKTTSDKITELHASSQQTSEKIKEIENQSKNNQQNITTITTKSNEQLQNASIHAADAKTKSDATNQILANAKQKEAEINAFYQKLEAYKSDMTEVKRKADADYAQTKDECISMVKKHEEETQNIIAQNEQYQVEIKELLHKAVSAGLFGVFKQRQEYLANGRNFWRWSVIVSSLLVVSGIVFVSWNWSTKPDIIFFVRLGVMIPLAFLMYFTAAQYRKERQAEEEYAFKSAISFSIEPYRDLLIRMRESGELEADFVKKLMEDIFDNPVTRLYSKEEQKGEGENLLDLLKTLLQKVPADKKNIIMEAVKKVVVGDKS